MKVLLILPTKWKTLEKRIKALSEYLSRQDRLGLIYGEIKFDYLIQPLPSLKLQPNGVYDESDILKITQKYHKSYDAVGLVFPVIKGEKYAGNYYPNYYKGGAIEHKMDFYIKADEKTKQKSGYWFEEFIEHELAGHAVALDLGLTNQGTDKGYVKGADNTHHFFYGGDKEGHYKEINALWKAKSSIYMQIIEAGRKLIDELNKKKLNKLPDAVLPAVQWRLNALIATSKALGDEIFIVSGFRSFDEQNKLYDQGRTTKGKIVTNAKGGESMHNFGISIDFAFKKKPNFPKSGDERWNRINRIAQTLGFYSYGLSEGWDDGHIQLMLGYSEADFRNKKVDFSKFQ